MSNDESIEQATTEPVAPTESPSVDAAPSTESTSDATPAEVSGDPATSSGDAGAAEAEATPAGDAPKKKRRRRRRKKKPAADAGAATESNSENDGEDASEEATAEATAEEGSAAAEGAKPEGASKRAKKPRKKPVPAERPAFNLGDEVFGRVSRVSRDAVFIDVAGGKAVGLFDRTQLIAVPPLVGEQFIGTVQSLSTRGGMLILGPEPFDTKQARLELRVALESKNAIECWVTGLVKGGIEVDYKGTRGFAPASHVELVPGASLAPLLGEKLPFVVTQYGKKGRDLVLSRKEMLEKEHSEKRAEALAGVEAGAVCKAVVRNVLAWGAFVSLPDHGDVEGVIHMTEVSHDRGARLSSVLSPGQEIEVKVLRIDEKGKLWLSRKAMVEDPWTTVADKYAVGSIHRAKVARLTEFGAFLQLEPGIDGLCHVADLSFEPVEHPNQVVREGDELEVIVAGLDRDKHKIALHPAPPEDERGKPRVKVAPHQVLQVQVKQIKEAGLGVRIVGLTGRHARGFIPAGQTGTPRGTDLRKTFPVGTTLQAKVVEVDPRRGEARLSIRAMKDDEEKNAYREYRKKVAREATFGTFGDLLKKLER